MDTKWELELEGTWGITSTGSGGDAAHEVVDDKNDDGSVPVSTFGRSTTVTGRPSLSQGYYHSPPAATTSAAARAGGDGGEESGRGPWEQMVVPRFNGGNGDDGEELGYGKILPRSGGCLAEDDTDQSKPPRTGSLSEPFM